MTYPKSLVWLLQALLIGAAAAEAPAPTDDEIREILKDRVETFKQSVGIVVGLIDSSGTRVVSYGVTHKDGDHPIDRRTIFEIGSISKAFTAVLLADMIRQHEVSLRDPASIHLPDNVILPTRSGRKITLLDLATHRSGLPRMPDKLSVGKVAPGNTFTVEEMYSFLSETTLAFDIGERYYYSNLAFGLLGHLLARRADTDYESLLIERVCEPLGLTDTRITLDAERQTRLAGAHSWNGDPTQALV